MILNTLETLRGITDITPHSLRTHPFKTNGVSKKLIKRLTDFTVDINNKILEVSSKNIKKDDIVSEFADYTKRFKQIQNDIIAEIPSKNGGMHFIPEEYVEVIYIITYQMSRYLGVGQEYVAKILNINKRDYRDRWGISPANDCKAKQADYRFALPIDSEKEELRSLICYVNDYMAEISCSYLIGVSNRMSLFANIENTNKSVNCRKEDGSVVYGRQFYHNISSIEDLYSWIFIEHIVENSSTVKENAHNLVCTDDIEMNEEVLSFLLSSGIEIKAQNLIQNDYDGFQRKYQEYLAKVKDREIWNEVIEHPEIPYDELMVEEKELVEQENFDREQFCLGKISELDKKINEDLQSILDYISIETFKTEDTLRIYKYLVDKYNSSLADFKPELFADKDAFSAKYLIARYFSMFGVSTETIKEFNKYLSSRNLLVYVNRYKNDYISAFKDGLDINDNKSLLDKVKDLDEIIKGRKEKRTIPNAVILIDADCYPVDNLLIEEILKINSNFHPIIISSEKLTLPLLEEKVGSTYIYNKEREKA